MTSLTRLALSIAGLATLALTSCSTPPPVEWRQVKKNPPTYYPAGFDQAPGKPLPKGNWVADEKREVNFFVPDGGTAQHTAAELHTDAVSRVSPSSLPPDRGRTRIGLGVGVGFGGW